jgi:hypothetical protein
VTGLRVHAGPVRRGERRRTLTDDSGSSLVEFALVLPLVFFVIVASMSVLWMLAARSTLSGAARDGARFASIRIDPYSCDLDCDGIYSVEYAQYPEASDVAEYVNERAGIFGPVDVVVEPGPDEEVVLDGSASRLPNSPITVRVSRDLPLLFKPFGALLGEDALEFETEAKVRAE